MNSDTTGRKVVFDHDSVYADIEGVLDDIKILRADPYFVKALGDKTLQKIKNDDALIRKRLNDAFSIVVIGDFKRGKSTLINALLGEAVAPTAVTPETVTINQISFSQTPKIEAVLKDRRRAVLSRDELKREGIEQVLEQLPEKIEYIDIKANVELLRDIAIIDTPGIGDLLRSFDAQVADYLVNADAIIYVISARSPLSLSEQAFLSSTVIPQNFARVLLAVNMSDTLETEKNVQKIRELTVERANAIHENIQVHMISALDEFCRKQNLKRPEPELAKLLEDNFLAFETALQNDVILQKDIIKTMRGVVLVRSMLEDVAARVNLIKLSLKANVEKMAETHEASQIQNTALLSNIEKQKASLSSGIDEMAVEAKNWLYDFMSKLKSEIASIDASTHMADIERHLQFYLMDMIKNAVLSCTQRHQREIGDRLSDSAKTIANEISLNAFGGIHAQIADCITDISWTNIDSAVFAGDIVLSMSGFSDVIGPLYLVGQAIAGFIRQRVISKKQADFIAPILSEYNLIVHEVVGHIDGIYQHMKRHAMGRLDELYQNQVEISLETIRQAQQVVSDENTKAQDVIAYLDEVLQNIQSFRERLVKYN